MAPLNLADDRSQTRQNGLLGLCGPNHQREIVLNLLKERNVENWWNGRIQRTFLDVLDNPYDFQGRSRNRDVCELLADWIFTREVFARQGLVDNGCPGLGSVLVFRKIAPAR